MNLCEFFEPDDVEVDADILTSGDETSDDMSDEIGAAISAFISENTPRPSPEYSGDAEDYEPAFDDVMGEHDANYHEGDYDEFGHAEQIEYGDEDTYEEGFYHEGGECDDFYAGGDTDEAFADPNFANGEEAHGEFDHQVLTLNPKP